MFVGFFFLLYNMVCFYGVNSNMRFCVKLDFGFGLYLVERM